MKWLSLLSFFLFLFPALLLGQFAPAAGEIGTTAIAKDSNILVAWATQCVVERGPMDISQPSLGVANAGTTTQATGPAGDGLTLSLGDGGKATLTFARPISNGVGADFAVFENAFNNTFLELAFVEVSSDGQNFVRFPALSNTDTSMPVGSFGAVDPRQLYNLAGKYRANFGTPFDLEELKGDSLLLNINAVTHVRLVDAVGSLQDAYATRDSRGYKVNDPWTTPFASSGFDLDAVGVIHQGIHNSIQQPQLAEGLLFPNPLQQGQLLHYKNTQQKLPETLSLYNSIGQLVFQQASPSFPLALPSLRQGCYTLLFWVEEQAYYHTLVIL